MPQDTYNMLIRGFDVMIEPSDQSDYYHVIVSEGGTSAGWEIDIPVELDKFEGDNEELDGSDAIMNYVGNAAVDLYEAEHDSLGEGASLEVAAMKKRAFRDSLIWEEWFMSFKDTPFEEQAASLLKQYLDLMLENSTKYQVDLTALYQEHDKILYDLDMLNLERMKTSKTPAIVIVGQSKYAQCLFSLKDQVSQYLDNFQGCALEAQAIAKVREFLDIKDHIDDAAKNIEDVCGRISKLENQMYDLRLEALQQNVQGPPTGIEGAPNMAADLADLMKNVDLNTPLREAKTAFEETEPVEERIDEKGELREGLDPAELEDDQYDWKPNDHVELKKELNLSGPGWGESTSWPKGTKGFIETMYDQHGDQYLFRVEDGSSVFVVDKEDIKKAG